MSEKPILFSGPMVRAILDGRKTMTRRVAKPRFDDRAPCEHYAPDGDEMYRHCEHGSEFTACPHGQPGDTLWARETWRECGSLQMVDGSIPKDGLLTGPDRCRYAADDPTDGPFRPSIHMPRWASRLTLEVVSVRVERVQDISEADAIAEGCELNRYRSGHEPGTMETPRIAFERLWDSLNGKRGYGWEVNPFVWVIGFKVIERRST